MIPQKHVQCNQMVITMFFHTPPDLMGIGTMLMTIIFTPPSPYSASSDKYESDGMSVREELL